VVDYRYCIAGYGGNIVRELDTTQVVIVLCDKVGA
jgi:hypothetical protein